MKRFLDWFFKIDDSDGNSNPFGLIQWIIGLVIGCAIYINIRYLLF